MDGNIRGRLDVNELQKKLRKIRACTQAVVRAGEFRTAKGAWHGWQIGSDLLWLLVALRMPRKRLKAALDAVVNQTQEWARAAEGKERARWEAKAACEAQAALYPAAAAYYAALAAAGTAEAAGLMTYWDAQTVLADLVRREIPWEEVKEFWEKETTNERITKEA